MDIKTSSAGKVVKALAGYGAFVPNPLPPQIEWTNDLVNSLSRADHLLGKLSKEAHHLASPHLALRPFIAREAVSSSKIEGTQSTLSELLQDQAGSDISRNPDDLQEVKNYITALDYGVKRLNDLPLSLRLIKEIHKELMASTKGSSHITPGEFRRSQNWIGTPGCTLTTAKYVPPPPEELMNTLGAFEDFLHDRTLPPLIHIALCHYQFEAIHPFLDGNGRVGRILIILLLIERNLIATPVLYISSFFEGTRDVYYQQLYSVSAHGTWNDWLMYFLNGIAIQSDDVVSRIERIRSIVDEWLILAQASSSSDTSQQVIRFCASNPYLTVKKVSEQLDVAFTTAQRAINQLETLGIIKQISEGKRDRVYCATKILEILEEPTRTRK